jgi:hypothetical protein
MSIPIKIEKVNLKTNRYNSSEQTKYLITVEERATTWLLTYQCSKDELLKFKNQIEDLITNTSVSETLNVTEEQERIIEDFYKSDALCQGCKFKLTNNCKDCIFVMQSPLERKLFVALRDTYIKFTPQYPIDWKGNHSNVLENKLPNAPINYKNILTIPDFFISRGDKKLCVYTDGHTFHEKTEDQTTRDKNIDRNLQKHGYTVMRFTGKEIRENIDVVIKEIKDWYDKGNT